ncbi:MAG TPA: NAD-dependent epimerase/dehydratase family protein [Casimicrobiaceae bacterium]|nr:NAD-dependent epimerase/dehydratase family protein [Casimicrobiaceae bacterium]
MNAQAVFVTGGTGYMGSALIAALLARGSPVLALTRPGSASRLPQSAQPVLGDALDADTFAAAIPRHASIVHLVGTPHPNPAKAAEFVRVDLGSIRASAQAASRAGASHIVYVSVAHPAPVMRAYIAARIEGEAVGRRDRDRDDGPAPVVCARAGTPLADRARAAIRVV